MGSDVLPNQTLGVKLTQGSPPYNYIWKKNGTTVWTTSSTSSYQDTYITSEYGNYVCEVTNACTSIPVEVSFSVAPYDPALYRDGGKAISAGLSWSLSGINCFDVSSANSSFPTTAEYTVNVSGGATIEAITWDVLDVFDIRQSPVPIIGNPTTTLSFKNRTDISTSVTNALTPEQEPIPVQIYLYALIALKKADVHYFVSDVIVITFDNRPCCEGAIIQNGAYQDPGRNKYQQGSFSPDWTGDALGTFTALNKDLCWNKSDVRGTLRKWTTMRDECSGKWRLPNLMELHKLYMALGGTGANTDGTKFTHLASNLVASGTVNMEAGKYWSITEWGEQAAYTFDFLDRFSGWRDEASKLDGNYKARCVRTLE